MRQGWLVWRDNRLWLAAHGDEAPLEGPGEVKAAAIDGLAFAMEYFGLIAFETSEGLSCWRSEPADISRFRRLPTCPAQQADMTSVGLHAKHGCVTVLLGRNLYVGTPAGWTSTDVPEGTLWVALGEAGVVWAVGSRLSNRIPGAAREAAAWRRAHWGRPWELVPVSLSFWDALRAVRGGGYEAFRAVNAGKSSVVFASECAWFVDDLSSFLYVWHEGGRCTMQRLRDRQLARIERDDSDMPRAFTTDGEAWLFDGRRFRPAGLAARLKRSLYTEAEQQYTVQMAYSPPVISGVVTLWYAGRRVGHRTIASKDDGVSWMFGDLIPPEILQRFIAGWISRVG